MTRRVSLPGADELFRSTAPAAPEPVRDEPEPRAEAVPPPPAPAAAAAPPTPADPDDRGYDGDGDDLDAPARPSTAVRRRPRTTGERRPTGRERHEEKITVYCSADELIDLERARLTLRGDHGLAIDRGRIVREAIAFVLSDLEAKGDQSILVRRLRGR